MSRFLNKKYSILEAYVPGEQPQGMKYIKLNTNESPYPPAPGVIKAVNSEEVSKLRLYSDPDCVSLKKCLADLYSVNTENVFLSNGSDDILNFAFMAFGDSETGVAFPEISYGFYKVFAQLHGLKELRVPLEDDFSINPIKYHDINRFIVIANPNAPTGLTLSIEDIESILKSNPDHVVLIDEAYVDFGDESCYPLTQKYDNLLVVQTFSKSRSLAGARLGFAIGSRELISDLERIKFSTNPYSINRLTMKAGEAALLENDYYMENCKKIIASRKWTTDKLEELDFTVIPSKTNFVFAKSHTVDGKTLYEGLKARGILVRHFADSKIKDYNRITIGTPEEMEIFINAVKEILEEHK